jgi:hypothetical protein
MVARDNRRKDYKEVVRMLQEVGDQFDLFLLALSRISVQSQLATMLFPPRANKGDSERLDGEDGPKSRV